MNDPINAPSHYIEGRSFEPLDVINDWELGFCLGNALKYISRAGRKDNALEDLKKAAFYINREISYLEDANKEEPRSNGSIPLSVLGGSDEDINTFTVSSYAKDMAKFAENEVMYTYEEGGFILGKTKGGEVQILGTPANLYQEITKAEPQDLAPSEFEAADVDDDALDYWNESPERQDFLFEFDR